VISVCVTNSCCLRQCAICARINALAYLTLIKIALNVHCADTPLLLLAWRRAHTLSRVIDAIRPSSPHYVFVACDGPRLDHPGEEEKVAATREVIDQQIDWPCQIYRLYSETNQGCREGVIQAITWFFTHVESGIILEDDCVPHPDFFQYCTDLLRRYELDNRIFLITGHNRLGSSPISSDYLYSRLGGIWGWASWRRAWNTFGLTLSELDLAQRQHILENVIPIDVAEERYVKCRDSLTGKLDSWAYQWGYHRLINGGLSCVPKYNLITNIGGDDDSTHTVGLQPDSLFEGRLAFPLQHPDFLVPCEKYDAQYSSPTKYLYCHGRHIRDLLVGFKEKILTLSFRYRFL